MGAKTHRRLNSQPCLEEKSYIMMKEGFEGFLMAKVMEWFALSLPPKQFLLGLMERTKMEHVN